MNNLCLGTHILLNLFDCEPEFLNDLEKIRQMLRMAVDESDLTRVGESFHQFEPCGVTGVILLSESHICIHTWPELNSAAIDIFSCSGETKANKAAEFILKEFDAGKFDKKVFQR